MTMQEIKDRLFKIRNDIGAKPFDVQPVGDRLERIEEALRSLIDIMVEACDEHEGH